MKVKTIAAASAIAAAIALSGCANDGSLALSTGSINDTSAKPVAQRVDPACVALMARIDDLRREGTPERIAKVATGKTKTASVKREALARMTELDAANADFQQKCSTLAAPKSTAAQPAKTAAVATTTNAAINSATAKATKTVQNAAAAKATDAVKAAATAKATQTVKSAATAQVAKTVAAAQ